VDRFFLPEHHIPNIKLFPRGGKTNFVAFPSSRPRTLRAFIDFIQQYTGIDVLDSIRQQSAEYLSSEKMCFLIDRAEAAFAFIVKQRMPQQIAAHRLAKDVDRFLAMYFLVIPSQGLETRENKIIRERDGNTCKK
jgi:hypothetical protein